MKAIARINRATLVYLPWALLGLLALLALPAFGPLRPAGAQPTCTVTSTADSGAGTLRARLADANCEVIDFDPGILPGAITLVTELTIGRDVTIDGPGPARLFVSGNNSVRVFRVQDGNTVVISGLTITGGNSAEAGGGIENHGTLTVTNSTISGNFAEEGGGGIFNGGTLTVTNSTISGNVGESVGGGILNFGTLSMTNSTISGNSALDGGGGIFNHSGGALTVTNSTISDNSAAGGGGIWSGGAVTIKNSIVAASPSGGNCSLGGGTFDAEGDNLADDSTCTGFTQVQDVMLDDMADNGGPTLTRALVPGSPAIDAVTDCTLADGTTPVTTDQRGVPRPQGAFCDIGAFELEPSLPALWGDVDCDGSVAIGDALKVARWLLGLSVSQEEGCPEIGTEVELRV